MEKIIKKCMSLPQLACTYVYCTAQEYYLTVSVKSFEVFILHIIFVDISEI